MTGTAALNTHAQVQNCLLKRLIYAHIFFGEPLLSCASPFDLLNFLERDRPSDNQKALLFSIYFTLLRHSFLNIILLSICYIQTVLC